MSQYEARLYIRVINPNVWEKLYRLNLFPYCIDESARQLFDISDLQFVYDDWSCDEDRIELLIKRIHKLIGNHALLIADCTDYNVDSFAHIVYSIGDGIKKKRIDGDFFDQVDIGDICNYLNYNSYFDFSKKELEFMELFHIRAKKSAGRVSLRYLPPNANLSDEIFLIGTRDSERIERIEHVDVGDELVLDTKVEYGICRIEVFHNLGSLGYLDDESSNILIPFWDKEEIIYQAHVQSVIPLSKRAKYCKTAIISVHIDLEYTNAIYGDLI